MFRPVDGRTSDAKERAYEGERRFGSTGDIADFGHVIGGALQGVRILTASMLLAEVNRLPT